MNIKLSKRSEPDFQSDFLAGILSANNSPDIITFAGGNPNQDAFPLDAINAAASAVLKENGIAALQYSGTQGWLPLREHIAAKYKKQGIPMEASDIIVTNGSQQALDLFSSVMIDPGCAIAVEDPTYLAALQNFHLYSPEIVPVELKEDGIDAAALERVIRERSPRFIYLIPNYQNPTGVCYSEEARKRAADVLRGTDVMVLEDDPYGELSFYGDHGKSFGWYLGEQCCMLGTFSKTVSPGMRIGWIACREKRIRERMLTYKSAVDIHTNVFAQMVLARFLDDNDLDALVENAKALYRHRAEHMVACIEKYFPEGCSCTRPRGGMFIWVTLPEGLTGLDVRRETMKKNVAVCPGDAFFEKRRNVNFFRLNFSNASDDIIDYGMKVVGDAIKTLLNK